MHKLQLGPAGNAVDHERVMALAGLCEAPNLRTVYTKPVQDTPTVIEGLARPRRQALAKSEAYQPPNSPHFKNHRAFEKSPSIEKQCHAWCGEQAGATHIVACTTAYVAVPFVTQSLN